MGRKKSEFKYADVVAHAFNLPNFNKAWADVGDGGAGSGEALHKAWELVTASDWHTQFLTSEMGDIMMDAAEWANTVDMKRDQITDPSCPTGAFAAELLNQLRTIAAGYIVIGVMVGIMSVSYDAEPNA